MDQNSPLSVSTSFLKDNIHEICEQWMEFQEKAKPSYFQSWAWIGPWWEHSGKFFEAEFFTVTRNNTPIAIAIFTPTKKRRHYLITSRQYHLNESGAREYDFTIEHNGILTTEPDGKDIAGAIIKNILSNHANIDEIVFSGVSKNNYNDYLLAGLEHGLLPQDIRISKYSFIDLDKLRDQKIDFISTLSSNTRSRIRRSIKAYETKFGPVNIEEAANLNQALLFLDQLKYLHQEHWMSKGKAGSFDNKHWENFIKSMIKMEFEEGRVQLLRVSAGETDIGYILNLIHDGYINMLQSGFKYYPDNKMKPGYVSHYLAIQHNIDKNNHVYDFLAGDSQYKDSLSADNDELYWFTLQKRKPKFFLENLAVKFVRTLRGYRKEKVHDT